MRKTASEKVSKSRASWIKSGGTLKQIRVSREASEKAHRLGLFDGNFSAWVCEKILSEPE